MKITILSEIDYAGSAHKMSEALIRYTDHDIAIFTGRYYNPYRHPDHSHWKRKDVQERINKSDIIHIKGDFPPKNGYLGFDIMHKPIVVTVSGSKFRKAYHGGFQNFHPWEFKRAKLLTAFEPDLLYPEYSNIWTPHPIDSLSADNEFKRSGTPVLMHSPSSYDMKLTRFFMDIAQRINEQMDVKIEILEKIPYKSIIKERKRATIFFDQFRVGFYGNSALEAMQYGIPVCAWISPEARRQAEGKLSQCPVIMEDCIDADIWANKILTILDRDMTELSIRTKDWCDSVHSYQAIAKQWNELYLQLEI